MKCQITIHDVETSEYALLAETLARAVGIAPHCANIDIYCQERADNVAGARIGDLNVPAYRCVVAVKGGPT